MQHLLLPLKKLHTNSAVCVMAISTRAHLFPFCDRGHKNVDTLNALLHFYTCGEQFC